jgi:hypothetical protein
MSIEGYYTKKVSVEGLIPVIGTDKEIFEEKITDLFCRIEQQGEEPVMLGDGAFYNLFKMWCADVNIKEGDKVIDSEGIIYIVKGISKYEKGSNPAIHHLEILLAVPR